MTGRLRTKWATCRKCGRTLDKCNCGYSRAPKFLAAVGLAFILATSGAAGLVSGGGWCNAGDCVPAPALPAGPVGSPWGWLPFGLPGGPFG